MNNVEAAVLNFRNLDRNVTEFMTEYRTRAAAEIEHHNKRDQEIKDALHESAEKIKADLDARHTRRDLIQWFLMAFIALMMMLFALPTAISAWKAMKAEVPAFIHSIVGQAEYALNRTPPQDAAGGRTSW